MYAEIAVNVPSLAGVFHYLIPAELRDSIAVGSLVRVPFGRRPTQGVVVGLTETAAVTELKPIEAPIIAEPVLSPQQIELAFWMAHNYVAPLSECLTLMLPPGIAKRADTLYTLLDPQAEAEHPLQSQLLRLLKSRGPLRGRQIERSLPRRNWQPAAEALARRGVLARQNVLDPPTVRAKQVRTVRLATAPEQAAAVIKQNLPPRSAVRAGRMIAVIDCLAGELEPVEAKTIYAKTSATLNDLKRLAELGLVDLAQAEVWRDSLAGHEFVSTAPPLLTADQQVVLDHVLAAIHGPVDRTPRDDAIFLLHGVTGSGKTEIYLRALGETLASGRQGIVLVPEIALTPQTVCRFAARFPGRVAVWHSGLGEGERYDTWRRARAGLVDVVIGPRSALFAPLPRPGLIVVDEEHDQAYKQDTSSAIPYHARETAVEYACRLGAVCLLGSATPDLTTYYRAREGVYRLLELPRRIMGDARRLQAQADRFHVTSRYQTVADGPAEAQTIDLPPVEMVDLRQELRAGNISIFSRRLQAALRETLARDEQAILFLNRRGRATYVFCRDCGQTLICPQCAVPLTQHGTAEPAAVLAPGPAPVLVCHHCNYRRQAPAKCPHCGSNRIRHFGAGTERVEETVRALWPQARILRWDRDVTRYKGAHDLIMQKFSRHEADVLVGTQMIAKGLDLPLVTLVGVVLADVGLGLPDYRAAERTFQVLTQVAGRAGRGLLGGRVILQTYQPEHYVLQAAAQHDYAAFFARELRGRRELGYPPFRRLMRLVYRHPEAERAQAEAELAAESLRAALPATELAVTDLVGPTPCFFAKVGGYYRWQIVVRGPDPAALVRGKQWRGWYIDVDAVSLL